MNRLRRRVVYAAVFNCIVLANILTVFSINDKWIVIAPVLFFVYQGICAIMLKGIWDDMKEGQEYVR